MVDEPDSLKSGDRRPHDFAPITEKAKRFHCNIDSTVFK
jgi:hypothetical protein